jgi:hypothetical protein
MFVAQTKLAQDLRVAPGRRVELGKLDPGDTHGWDKEAAGAATDALLPELTELQERLWAEG